MALLITKERSHCYAEKVHESCEMRKKADIQVRFARGKAVGINLNPNIKQRKPTASFSFENPNSFHSFFSFC